VGLISSEPTEFFMTSRPDVAFMQSRRYRRL
jgi:hypothetical protein